MPAKKRKVTQATPEIEPPAAAPANQPDVFDEAIAARATTAAAVPPEIPKPDAGTEQPAGDAPGDPGPRPYQADPFPALSVALGDERDAPRVHLYRNRRMNQVAVRFDEKPDEAHRQRLRDEGYTWRANEGVWTKQLGERRATGQIAAERLVAEVADAIRADKGLAPAGQAVGV